MSVSESKTKVDMSATAIAQYRKRIAQGDRGHLPSTPSLGVPRDTANTSAVLAAQSDLNPKLWAPDPSEEALKASHLSLGHGRPQTSSRTESQPPAALSSGAASAALHTRTHTGISEYSQHKQQEQQQPNTMSSLASRAAIQTSGENTAAKYLSEGYAWSEKTRLGTKGNVSDWAHRAAEKSQTLGSKDEALAAQGGAAALRKPVTLGPLDISKIESVARDRARQSLSKLSVQSNKLLVKQADGSVRDANPGSELDNHASFQRDDFINVYQLAAQRVKTQMANVDRSLRERGVYRNNDRERQTAFAIASEMSSKRTANFGKLDIGGGLFMSQDEIDEIARRHVQPVLDKVTKTAEDQREQDRIAAEKREAELQAKEEQKAKERAEKEERKAKERAEKEERKAKERAEKEERRRVQGEEREAERKAKQEQKAKEQADKEERRAKELAEKEEHKTQEQAATANVAAPVVATKAATGTPGAAKEGVSPAAGTDAPASTDNLKVPATEGSASVSSKGDAPDYTEEEAASAYEAALHRASKDTEEAEAKAKELAAKAELAKGTNDEAEAEAEAASAEQAYKKAAGVYAVLKTQDVLKDSEPTEAERKAFDVAQEVVEEKTAVAREGVKSDEEEPVSAKKDEQEEPVPVQEEAEPTTGSYTHVAPTATTTSEDTHKDSHSILSRKRSGFKNWVKKTFKHEEKYEDRSHEAPEPKASVGAVVADAYKGVAYDHPDLVDARAEIKGLKSQLKTEEDNIAEAKANVKKLEKSNEDASEAQDKLASLQKKHSQNSQHYRELKVKYFDRKNEIEKRQESEKEPETKEPETKEPETKEANPNVAGSDAKEDDKPNPIVDGSGSEEKSTPIVGGSDSKDKTTATVTGSGETSEKAKPSVSDSKEDKPNPHVTGADNPEVSTHPIVTGSGTSDKPNPSATDSTEATGSENQSGTLKLREGGPVGEKIDFNAPKSEGSDEQSPSETKAEQTAKGGSDDPKFAGFDSSNVTTDPPKTLFTEEL